MSKLIKTTGEVSPLSVAAIEGAIGGDDTLAVRGVSILDSVRLVSEFSLTCDDSSRGNIAIYRAVDNIAQGTPLLALPPVPEYKWETSFGNEVILLPRQRLVALGRALTGFAYSIELLTITGRFTPESKKYGVSVRCGVTEDFDTYSKFSGWEML